MIRLARITTLAGYFGLFILLMIWKTWLAPSAHYPVSLVLIVLVGPLLLPLRGLLHGRPYTHAWTSFLALFYFVIGVDDIAGGTPEKLLAWLEVILSITLFTGCLAYVRLAGRQRRTLES